ncbi:MAG: amidohydrolase family protein [Anaerolineaceae bacterium]|nr:amidohydrolase family protein [Anaerolineaceae bacterium]
MIYLDSHAHVDVVPALNWYDTADKLVQRMDAAGVSQAAISGYLNAPGPNPHGLQVIAEAVTKYPHRLIGYARLDPWYDDRCVDALNEAVTSWGCRGVKLHPAHYTLYPFGPETVKLANRAGELGLPILFHCGDEIMCLPYQIDRLAEKCPHTTIILAHIGGFFSGEAALNVAERRSNVLVDTSEIPFPQMVRKAVDRLGPEKVLWGTDAPCCDIGHEILKVRLAGFSEEVQQMLFAGNYARLMGIELEANHANR